MRLELRLQIPRHKNLSRLHATKRKRLGGRMVVRKSIKLKLKMDLSPTFKSDVRQFMQEQQWLLAELAKK